jgi:hypothetical protein
MPVNIAWGPVATVPANTLISTSALSLDPTDTQVTASADLAAQAAGISYDVRIQYRASSTGTFTDLAGVTGITAGGPDHDRQGNVVETGVKAELPSPGLSGRQVRAQILVSQTMTNISGHVVTT